MNLADTDRDPPVPPGDALRLLRLDISVLRCALVERLIAEVRYASGKARPERDSLHLLRRVDPASALGRTRRWGSCN